MQLLLNALIAGSLAALIASGLALVYGVLGVFNMALGQMVLFGGYVTWWAHRVLELPLVFSMVIGLLGGAVLSWVSFKIFVEPFYKRHRFLPLVTTISLSMILDGVLLLLFREAPRSILSEVKNTVEYAGAFISTEQIVLIIGTIALLLFVAYMLHSTVYGRRIRAVVQHDKAALSLGIPAPLLHVGLFVLSGILASFAGIFIGIDTSLTPTLAFPLTIKAYAAVIAGGRGNIWGAVTCAYLIALLEQLVVGVHWLGRFYIPIGYQQTVALLCIIIFLLWKPEGLFVSRSRSA